MRIAFEATPLINGSKSGVGHCESELVKRMIMQNPNEEFEFQYISRTDGANALREYAADNAGVTRSSFSSGMYRLSSLLLPVPYSLLIPSICDATHFFNYIVPPGVRGKAIATVHDMAFLRFPETVRAKTRHLLQLGLKKSLKRSDAIVTVSEFSKKEILHFYEYPPDKVHVIKNGVDLDKFNNISSREYIGKVKAKYGISGDYILYLGNLEPRKNIERLIEAFARVKDSPNLVIAGGKGWLYSSIFEKAKSVGKKSNVFFPGYVEDADKAALYSGAVFFAFPSLYEGFGMPPLEAMACGAPCLVSNAASLPEVCGDAAIYADPNSIEDMSSKIEQLLSDGALRSNLRQRGLARSKRFDWANSAKRLYSLYQKVVSS
jgi:glycosyltransferase involved in cell wall biosynthesis